ncbi:MAG: TIGR00282 family metallophosphoesterase [Patescibacteria group bacterium]|nr:TIGR00282 family metallophosphoesterase [Patescibacteria group bacterium]
MIKVLFIGDICGKPGRQTIKAVLPQLREKYEPDLVIADIENLAHGRGATVKTVDEIMSYGIDFMTAGNHIWRRRDFETLLSGEYPVIRPINYPDDIPGKGYEVIDLGVKGKLLVAIVLGRAFFPNENCTSDMLRPLDKMLNDLKEEEITASMIEVHAETTSEKIASAIYFDGRVSAVVGTHTHVPTADERVLSKGTGFISDVGMVGPMNSSLWVKPEIIIQQMKYPYAPAYDIQEDGKCRFDAVILHLENPGFCSKIQRVNKVL